MIEIYYIKNNKQIGPIKMTEVPHYEISKNTLVWFKGLKEWKTASQLESFNEYFESRPPEIPILIQEKKSNIENSALASGIFFLFTPIVYYLFEFEKTAILLSIIIIRLFCILMIIELAELKKRNVLVWCIFSFFFPPISLIILSRIDIKTN